MYDAPTLAELIESVKAYIDETAVPKLDGRAAFHGKVASNVLAIVLRELAQRDAAEAREVERLKALLKSEEVDATALNTELSQRIRRGELSADTSGLIDHLRETAQDQIEIDQPRYQRALLDK